jgi:hypothetical protein
MPRLILAVLVVVAAVAAAEAGTATASTGAVASVPVTGTASGEPFAGTMDVTTFAVDDGRLVALGTVAGTPFAAPAQPQQAKGGCTLFAISIGPFDVNVAGLVAVHLDPIALDVTLNGFLGELVCGLLGGGGGTPPPLP